MIYRQQLIVLQVEAAKIRKAIIRKKQKGIPRITNEIHFYYSDTENDFEKLELMKSLGIIMHPKKLKDDNWGEMYGEICDQLEHDIK